MHGPCHGVDFARCIRPTWFLFHMRVVYLVHPWAFGSCNFDDCIEIPLLYESGSCLNSRFPISYVFVDAIQLCTVCMTEINHFYMQMLNSSDEFIFMSIIIVIQINKNHLNKFTNFKKVIKNTILTLISYLVFLNMACT